MGRGTANVSFLPKGTATRDASGQVLNALARNVPWLIGGSAGVSGPLCKPRLTFDGAGDFSAENPGGRNLHFGIRERAMGAILNGLSLSKVRSFGCGVFLIFSDYCRTAIRLSALMEIPVIHIFTHDSIGVGEDGPTHQPVEHLASLRAIPGLIVLRPADANETVEAWRMIMEFRHEPVTFDSDAAGACRVLGPLQNTPRWRALDAARMCSRMQRMAAPMSCCSPPAARSRCVSRRHEQPQGRGDSRLG